MSTTPRVLAFAVLTALLLPALATAVPPASDGARIEPRLRGMLDDQAGVIPVIIRYVDAPTDEDARRLLTLGFLPTLIRYQVVPAIAAEGDAKAIRAATQSPRVAYVSYDAPIPYTLDRAAVVGRATEAWGATYEDAAGVHAGGITGRGIRVAVVDSGIDATHPDLIWKPFADAAGVPAKTVRNYKIEGRSLVTAGFNEDVDAILEADQLAVDVPDSDNTGGHGTHVAGSVAGNGFMSDGKFKGAAPGAELVGYGAGEVLVVSMGLAAFDHIHLHHEEEGIRVVTNSWGGAGDWNPDSPVTIAARRLVEEDGLVVLFSAGNDAGDGSTIQTSVWANIPGMISVANYYDTQGWLDDSSSRGKRNLPHTWPTLAAPGTQIISTSAWRGPVNWVGTGQDAAINVLFGYGEPNVVSAPTPLVLEQEVAGHKVLVGDYASFTGTSMATPFVAGVAALVLEANPDLTPAQVKAILAATADMPDGRTFADDGFAIGRGVVDASEAVAVALRMRDGATLENALRTAYVDRAATPVEINLRKPRVLEITSHEDGDDNVPAGVLTVSGEFEAGPVTTQTVPLQPAGGVLPAFAGTPHIYQASLLDPFLAGGHTVLPGTTVDLTIRGLTSQRADITVSPATLTAQHLVTRGGDVAFGPFAAGITADGAGWQSENTWAVPGDAPFGAYVFETRYTVVATNEVLAGPSLAFRIGAPDPEAPSVPLGSPIAQQATFFEDGFEGDSSGWDIEQNGLGPGLLTTWTHMESPMLSWAGPHSGDDWFAVGHVTESGTEGPLAYTDLADVTLVSPVIDLTDASSATLSYWRSGASELDFDFLTVLVEPVSGGAATQVDSASGPGLGDWEDWNENTVALDAFVGQEVRLLFRFTSDDFSTEGNILGWAIDDVSVTGSTGGGGGTPVLVPTLAASATEGVGSLTVDFAFSAAGNVVADTYEIDFGDGSLDHAASAAGVVTHTYGPGAYTATLTATNGTLTVTTTVAIEVAPTGVVQVRIAGGPWVDAGVVSGATDATFSADVDATGLSGPVVLEARYYDAQKRLVRDQVTITVV